MRKDVFILGLIRVIPYPASILIYLPFSFYMLTSDLLVKNISGPKIAQNLLFRILKAMS